MLILGNGALARRDGAVILERAARVARETGMIGPAGTPAEGGWIGFNILHTAASRVAALDLGFVPGANSDGTPGRDVAGIIDGAQKGEIDFIYLLGADELPLENIGRPFMVYQGSHGDAGANYADVILPGATFTEKDGLFANFEGRVQEAERAVFPPGEAKEDWAILRALSDVLGKALPYETLTDLRAALVAEHPHYGRIGTLEPWQGADPAVWNGLGADGVFETEVPVGQAISDYYLTNPIARASRVMAECSRVLLRGNDQKVAAE